MKQEKNRIFLRYILSSIISTFGYSCYVFVDTIFLAMVNNMAIAALNVVLPAYSILLAVGQMIGIGASTLFAIARAQNKFEDGSEYYTNAMFSGVIFAIIFAIILLLFSEPILTMLGANSETLQLATEYLVGYMILAPFNVASIVVLAFIRCDDHPKLSGMASLIGSLSNVVLDAVFIFIFGWGMFGAAFATSLSPVVSLIICSKYFIDKKNSFHYIKGKYSFSRLYEICKLGFPSFISGMASSLTTLVFNKQLLNLGGNIALTAYGIIVNLGVVVNCLNNGITQGVGPLFSNSYGKKDQKSLNYYMRLTVLSIIVSFAFSYTIIALIPELLISVFNSSNDAYLTEITKQGMLIYFSGSLFAGMAYFFNTYFISVNYPLPSTIISILEAGVVITPIVLILPVFFDLVGVWLSYPVAQFIIMILAILMYIKYKKNLALNNM